MNRREFGEIYPLLRRPSRGSARRAEEERQEILDSLSDRLITGFCGTKLDCRGLSPGCRLCGEGTWSCLFINNICNARCFYCPVEQSSRAEPMSGGIRFPNPQDYAAYLDRLEIEGVGISGGEPILTWDKTLGFAAGIKKRFGRGVYLWLYTNGIALTPEKAKTLRDAGLDEIRFDISADSYSLEKAHLAAGVIPAVTVEIPAVPEDCGVLWTSLREMEDTGVAHLNLRQLRCTPHNAANLVDRGYTFLHGSGVTVLESELAALRTLRYASDNGITLPIHYCSFSFRDRFQAAGQRRRLAGFVKKAFEDSTPLGYIRRLSLRGDPLSIGKLADVFRQRDSGATCWEKDREGTRLHFSQFLFHSIDPTACSLSVSYWDPLLLPRVSYRNPFVELPVGKRKALCIERRPLLKDRQLNGEEAGAFEEFLAANSRSGIQECLYGRGRSAGIGASGSSLDNLRDVIGYEIPEWGLQAYC